MKNTFLNKIDSIISIKITGKNVYNFINKIIKNKINIYNLDIINRKEAIVKIKYKDYLKLKKMHTIYHFSIYSYHGKLRIRNYIKRNYIFYTAIILGLILLFILSKIILISTIIIPQSVPKPANVSNKNIGNVTIKINKLIAIPIL